MARQIAVFIGPEGTTGNLNEAGHITVFEKRQGSWAQIRSKSFNLLSGLGLRELRAVIREAVSFLDGCHIFVGRSVVGVPYYELEKAGISVWESQGYPGDILDEVLAGEEAAALERAAEENNPLPAPVEVGSGHYKISLRDIQKNNPGLTSKQVLQPFVKAGNFYELEVLCDHIPPWLEAELAVGCLESRVEKLSPREIRLTITQKTCAER